MYGSVFDTSKEHPFYNSMVGEFMHGTNYTGDTATSVRVSNSSYVYNDGATGKLVVEGWFWKMEVGGVIYTKSKFGGIDQPCKSQKGTEFERNSHILRSLNTLYPIPGIPGDPTVPCVCQGYRGTGGLLTIEYMHHTNLDSLQLLSELTNSSYAMHNVSFVRSINAEDRALFVNPCKGAVLSADTPGNRYEDILKKYKYK